MTRVKRRLPLFGPHIDAVDVQTALRVRLFVPEPRAVLRPRLSRSRLLEV